MADFRRYQPRHSHSGSRMGRRFFAVVFGIIALVILFKVVQGGGNANSDNHNQADASIQLRNENTNAPPVNTNEPVAETNQNTNTVVIAPDASELDLSVCSNAISQFGTRKSVALTFNLGAANEQANDLVAELVKDKIAASFFAAGTFAEKNPDFIKQLGAKGFGVYNRSYDNPKFSELSSEQVTAQLIKADLTISDLSGATTKPFFRPPYGDTSPASITAAQQAGYCTILWTVDALDWQTDATAEQARARVMSKARPGAIVMLSAGYDVTPEATKLIAADLRKAGYSLVSLVELLSSS